MVIFESFFEQIPLVPLMLFSRNFGNFFIKNVMGDQGKFLKKFQTISQNCDFRDTLPMYGILFLGFFEFLTSKMSFPEKVMFYKVVLHKFSLWNNPSKSICNCQELKLKPFQNLETTLVRDLENIFR
jgi:hypothetical protein